MENKHIRNCGAEYTLGNTQVWDKPILEQAAVVVLNAVVAVRYATNAKVLANLSAFRRFFIPGGLLIGTAAGTSESHGSNGHTHGGLARGGSGGPVVLPIFGSIRSLRCSRLLMKPWLATLA